MEWNFEQPRNLAVISQVNIVTGSAHVLYVSHDIYDGGWQFLDGSAISAGSAKIVGLGQMVDSDPALRELADLPEGYTARRESVNHPWVRGPAR